MGLQLHDRILKKKTKTKILLREKNVNKVVENKKNEIRQDNEHNDRGMNGSDYTLCAWLEVPACIYSMKHTC